MIARITPDQLDASPYREAIQSLVEQWTESQRPLQAMSIDEFTRTIRVLLLTTQNLARSTTIVQAVLAQAIVLDKPSPWVQQEIQFEAMLEGADRADFLRLELSLAPQLDDALLDTYNQRLTRFTHHD